MMATLATKEVQSNRTIDLTPGVWRRIFRDLMDNFLPGDSITASEFGNNPLYA
jgi:hypothetical protein